MKQRAQKIQPIENFDLNLMMLFRAVLTTKSISKAALKLRITQPAASNGLRRLRDAVGDEVFVKGEGGMVPTDFATNWALTVIPALEQIEGSLAASQLFDPVTWSGTIRVGVTDYLMETLMYDAIPELCRKAPHGQFRLIPMREREPHEDLSRGDLDLALGSFFKVRAHFYQRQLGHDSFSVIMRVGHPLAGKKISAAQYASAPQLLIAPWGQPYGIVDDVLAEQKLTRTIALTVPYFNAAPLVIERTDLISTVPLKMSTTWQRQFKIIATKPPIEIPSFNFYLLWAERSLNNPAHEWLRSELMAVTQRKQR